MPLPSHKHKATMQPKPLKGFIQPVGPQPASKSKTKSPSSRYWHRIRDCFTGQGPDIFVGVINRPHSCPNRLRRDQWSGWDVMLDHWPYSSPYNHNCPQSQPRQHQRYPCRSNTCNEDNVAGHNVYVPKQNRRLENEYQTDRVYNFQTRRYEKFRADELRDGGLWSDVRYCKDKRHRDPLLIRDAWGRIFVLRKDGSTYRD